MIPNELNQVLSQSPDVMSGSICFAGTRVPIQALLDTLDDGNTVEDFLDGFPDVSRQQALSVIQWEQHQARRTFGLEMAS